MISSGFASPAVLAQGIARLSDAGGLEARPILSASVDPTTKRITALVLHSTGAYPARQVWGGEVPGPDGSGGGIIWCSPWIMDASYDPPTVLGAALMRPGGATLGNLAFAQLFFAPVPVVTGIPFQFAMSFFQGEPCNVRVEPC